MPAGSLDVKGVVLETKERHRKKKREKSPKSKKGKTARAPVQPEVVTEIPENSLPSDSAQDSRSESRGSGVPSRGEFCVECYSGHIFGSQFLAMWGPEN